MGISDLILIHVVNLSVETLYDVLGMQIINNVKTLIIVVLQNLI